MKIIYNDSLDSYFNLASEEYFLCREGDIFLLWRNGESVIIGKNQNAFSEINIPFCEENGIKTVRRLTGGGAVFHDPGNVNFTFITDSEGEGLDFSRFTKPITDALKSFGLSAFADGRNDIICDGMKISGNAECVYDTPDGRKRLMHHGTLLFSADMTKLSGALKVSPEKLKSKGIKSVRSRVANISSLTGYKGPSGVSDFLSALIKYAASLYNTEARGLTEEEKTAISAIAKNKYSTWEWNFGSSPSLEKEVSERFPFGTVTVSFSADKGIIREISVTGDFFGTQDIKTLEKKLIGARMEAEELKALLPDVSEYILGATAEDIAKLIIG